MHLAASPSPGGCAIQGKEPVPDQPDRELLQHEALADAKPRSSISRREFARRAALASAVASIAPVAVTASTIPGTSLGGQSATQDIHPKAPPAAVAPQNPAPGAPKLSVESQSEADARFQAILVMYGARFSAEQKNDLHRLCAAVQASLDHIRAYKVENGDGPALYLKPQYEREKKPKPPAKSAPSKSAPAAGSPKKP